MDSFNDSVYYAEQERSNYGQLLAQFDAFCSELEAHTGLFEFARADASGKVDTAEAFLKFCGLTLSIRMVQINDEVFGGRVVFYRVAPLADGEEGAQEAASFRFSKHGLTDIIDNPFGRGRTMKGSAVEISAHLAVEAVKALRVKRTPRATG